MRLVLIGNYGVGNVGDEALREYFLHAFPEHEWIVLSAHPCGAAEVPRLAFGVRSFFTPWWRTLWALYRCDAVVFGGGSLFTDTESPRACTLWWYHAFCAWFFQKPVLLAFQGIGPFRTRLGERCAKWVVRRARFLSVRDAASAARVAQWSRTASVVETFDPVLSQIQKSPRDVVSASHIVLIPRRNSGQEFFDAVESSGTGPFTIVSLQPDDLAEELVIRTLVDRLDDRAKIVPVRTIQELVHALSGASYVVTQRYHGAIPALALGIPTTVVIQREGDKLSEMRSIAERAMHDPSVLSSAREAVRRGEGALREALLFLERRSKGS